jgi:ABC-type nitrate/sulfonate/bicarbonate transport system permease component
MSWLPCAPAWKVVAMYLSDRGLERLTAGMQWFIPGTLMLAGIGLWEILVRLRDTPTWLLPPPSAIGKSIIENWAMLLEHTWVTAQSALIGFAIAFVVGVGSAILVTSSRILERSLYPVIIATNAIPVIAIAPILLIWFGYGLTPKIIVVALICFFPIAVNTIDGLRSVDRDMVNLLRSLGASRWATFRLVRFPSSLPYLFSGTRIAAAVSVIGALVAEWVGSSAGLGYLMIRSASQFLTDRVFAAIFIAALMGIAMFVSISLLERWLLPWRRLEQERTE